MTALLLDEMLSNVIAEQLRAKGHDVLAAVADPALAGLADDPAITSALSALLGQPGAIQPGQVLFLTRRCRRCAAVEIGQLRW